MTTHPPAAHVPHLDQLVQVLDDIVRQHAGPRVADAVLTIRQLAAERRAGMPEAEARLVDELMQLDLDQADDVVRAFTMYFDLANLAEDLNRIRTLQQRSFTAADSRNRRRETIHDAIAALRTQGMSALEMQSLIDRLRIEPVFTAHPSEAKRRTTRQILRRLRQTLVELTEADTSLDSRPHLLQTIRADLTTMWQSDLMRPKRPHVMSEVERGLFFAEALWSVIPQITRDLREALTQNYPDNPIHIPPVLRFGTWIGGDRDGHPLVTAATTAETLDVLRKTALEGHLEQCRNLLGVVVMSDRHTRGLEPIRQAVEQAVADDPRLNDVLSEISISEVGRQWLKVIEHRLLGTLQGDPQANYASATPLEQDISLLIDVLNTCGCRDVVVTYVQPWLDTVRSFGLHFAAMDVRQHSGVHETVVDEVLRTARLGDGYLTADNDTRIQLLLESMDQSIELEQQSYSAVTNEALQLFKLLATRVENGGLAALGAYIISMTHCSSDVLAVMWLWNLAWRNTGSDQDLPPLPIAPLFETIDDLQRSASIVDSLWQLPQYRDYLRRSSDHSQMVMIGYSDSTKDGGYLAASWMLHQAQNRLSDLAERHGVRLVIFHGRGGALGRGGGPAARAVLSLPPRAVNGAMRVTEQGEILAERYDDPEIAFRHLEQVTWATLLVSGDNSEPAGPEFEAAMNLMADRSLAHYRELITHPDFLEYFESATPVAEIESLPIGSRPARRGNRRTLADLRAIPWTFAWTQSRHILPAWYGLGTAIRQFVDEQHGDWSLLRTMYSDWRFFAATIDNAELALAKTDIDIALRYSSLCDADGVEQIRHMIRTEYDRARASILLLKQHTDLLDDTGWLQRIIRARNPGVDPLNLLQIRLLAESRAAEAEAAESDESEPQEAHVLRLTIKGIAAGLRTTG